MNINKPIIWLVGTAFVLVVILALYSTYVKPKPIDVTKIIGDMKAELQKQYQKQLDIKDEDLKAKDLVIGQYKYKLEVSDGKYKSIMKKYADLEKEKANVKPATTDKELRDGFSALGLPALPTGQCGPGTICFSTGYSGTNSGATPASPNR
jgi:hypothetical protein